jgi:hypothetical protein
MAKLVEILAKELGEWPEDAGYAEQDKDKEVRFSGPTRYDFFASVLADECPDNSCIDGIPYSERVTREMWQAERDKLKPSACAETGYDGPLRWRDRISEIDAQAKAMATEREFLVSKLAGEGFALIAVAAEPVEDVSDWPVDAPDRKSAPKWARWIGRDRTGYYWFEGEPVAVKSYGHEFARGLLGVCGYPDYRHEEALDMSNDLPLWSCKL